MSLKIHPMCLGECPVESSYLAFIWNPGEKLLIPFTTYLILGGDEPILIDAGVTPGDPLESPIGGPARYGPEHGLETNLARFDLEPGDIGKVVFTHLHPDHTGLADQFPNAALLVQREELRSAAAPVGPDFIYDRVAIGKLVDPLWSQVELLDGDAEIAPGVRAVVTGGHSPGHQMLYVDVPSGQAIITGDVMYVAEPAMTLGLPPGYVVDMGDAVAAIERVKRDADHVLPMHDFSVYEQYPDGVS